MPHVPSSSRTRSSHRFRTRATHDYDASQEGLSFGDAVSDQESLDGIVLPGGIMPGTIASASFAAGIRPVAIVSTLPSLPDANYPPLSYAVLTTDSRLYKNIANVWVLGVDGADIVADSITAGKIAAGAIGASEIAVGALPSRNLLKNGGFRNNLTGWTFFANGAPGSFAAMWSTTATDWTLRDGDVDNWSAAAGPWGSTAYLFGSNTASEFFPFLSQTVPVVAGQVYSFSGLLGMHRLTAAYLELQFMDAAGTALNPGGTWISMLGNPVKSGGAWYDGWNYLYRHDVTAPANAVSANFLIVARTPNTSGTDWYLFCDQMWLGVGATARSYDPAEATSARNSTGRVLIDENGITILDGALALQDEFGKSVLTASGFSGPWTDFITLGLYNARFLQGTPGVVPFGRTAALPYWEVINMGGSPVATLLSAGGGLKVAMGSLTDAIQFDSDLVPVRPQTPYSVPIQASSNIVAGSMVVDVKITWYDYSGSAISFGYPGPVSYSITISADAFELSPVESPQDARYAKVMLQVYELGTHNAGNFLTLVTTGLREAPPENLSTLGLTVSTLSAVGSVTAPNLPARIQSGSTTVSVTASTTGSASVSFATAFAVAPKVVATTSQSGAAYAVSVTSITTSGFTINVRHIDATSTTTSFAVQWIAMQN